MSGNKIQLNDNVFGDITFDELHADGLVKISTKAFGKTASTLKVINALNCSVANHDVWTALSQLSKVNSVSIGLDVNEIPQSAIIGNEAWKTLEFQSKQSLTIRTGQSRNCALSPFKVMLRVARSGTSRPGTICLHLILPPLISPFFTTIFLVFKKVFI